MADNQEQKNQAGASAPVATKSEGENRTADPGRTPGKAEGDEENVDESLARKGDR